METYIIANYITIKHDRRLQIREIINKPKNKRRISLMST